MAADLAEAVPQPLADMPLPLADMPLPLADANRLRWRCRRGLLENDLLIARYFERHGDALSRADAAGLMPLMDLADNDLLDLLLARKNPTGELDNPHVRRVLAALRTPEV